MNLRDITTLVSRFDTNDKNLDYDEVLERISQENARDGRRGALEDAATHISGIYKADEGTQGSGAETEARSGKKGKGEIQEGPSPRLSGVIN